MRKSKIEKRLPEPKHSKEKKDDATSVRPSIAKPNVICCQSKNELIFYTGIGHDCQVTRSLQIKIMELGLQ